MAKAMNPVYLVSFLLKVFCSKRNTDLKNNVEGSATIVGYIYVLILCCEDDRYFVVIDFSYYLVSME